MQALDGDAWGDARGLEAMCLTMTRNRFAVALGLLGLCCVNAHALPQDTPGTHCKAHETVYFSCPVSRTKVVSLCRGDDWLQYRFGPLKRPELVFPTEKLGSLKKFEGEQHYHAALGVSASWLSFKVGRVQYALAHIEPDDHKTFIGIEVTGVSRKTMRIPCMKGRVQGDIDSAISLVPESLQ